MSGVAPPAAVNGTQRHLRSEVMASKDVNRAQAALDGAPGLAEASSSYARRARRENGGD
jgi:hypothetical protein